MTYSFFNRSTVTDEWIFLVSLKVIRVSLTRVSTRASVPQTRSPMSPFANVAIRTGANFANKNVECKKILAPPTCVSTAAFAKWAKTASPSANAWAVTRAPSAVRVRACRIPVWTRANVSLSITKRFANAATDIKGYNAKRIRVTLVLVSTAAPAQTLTISPFVLVQRAMKVPFAK